MNEDCLSKATQALRETAEASEFEARSTRTRVMISLHQTRVRRRARLVFLLPIAATFMAVSAWGAANGKARDAFTTLQHWIATPRPTLPAARPTLHSPLTPALAPPSTPAVASPSAATLPSAPRATLASPPASPPRLTRAAPLAPVRLSPPSPAATVNDPTLALYRAAHTAHFVDHDPARALAGWDAYLAAAPNGLLAPEARYNRALSLVRLGRNTEARAALEPFANGSYGDYRQDEAGALLERLRE